MEMRETAFMGKITAGVTHEMKNVLAIIKESAGLMKDLLSITDASQFPHKERFARVISNIDQQVIRGVDLSTRLNKFAHGSDDISTRLDLRETVDEIVFFSQRFARIKNISVSAELQQKPVMLVINPIAAQMAIFECLDFAMDLIGSGGHVKVKAEEMGDKKVGVEFYINNKKFDMEERIRQPEFRERWLQLVETARSINANVEKEAAHELIRFIFERK